MKPITIFNPIFKSIIHTGTPTSRNLNVSLPNTYTPPIPIVVTLFERFQVRAMQKAQRERRPEILHSLTSSSFPTLQRRVSSVGTTCRATGYVRHICCWKAWSGRCCHRYRKSSATIFDTSFAPRVPARIPYIPADVNHPWDENDRSCDRAEIRTGSIEDRPLSLTSSMHTIGAFPTRKITAGQVCWSHYKNSHT